MTSGAGALRAPARSGNETEVPTFGHVTAWSVQLAYVFCVYAAIGLVCVLWFVVARHRKVKQLAMQAGADNVEAEALLPMAERELQAPVVADARPHGPLSTWRFFVDLVSMSPMEMRQRCGPDAMYYLTFQRYVLLSLLAMAVFGLAVLLPIYAVSEGTVKSTDNQFDLLTAVNLAPGDPKLWAVLVSLVLNSFLMYLLVARIFRSQMLELEGVSVLALADFTVQFSGLPLRFQNEDELRAVMERHGPVFDCVIGANLDGLHAMHGRVKQVLRSLSHAEAWNNLHPGQRLKVNRRCCGLLGAGRDAVEFYTDAKAQLRKAMAQLRHEHHVGNGMAFVVFQQLSVAQTVARAFAAHPLDPPHMETARWTAHRAPAPTDVIHQNLQVGRAERVLRIVLINVVLAVLMMIFTTPISLFAVLSALTNSDVLNIISTSLASAFSFFGDANTVYGFLSSTLMATFTIIVPRIMIASAKKEYHHTRSHLELSIVRKIFAFLLLAVVLMPSFFITSVLKLAVDGLEILRDLGGVFPRAIFFVNYLLAVGLVSNFFELLNFPASLVSWYRRRKAITSYERARAAKSVPFQVGYEYAYLLALLSMTLLFSTVVPILVPFGILTFATKHLVDRNNLVYVYTSTTHSNAALVRVVLTQVVIGTALYQLAMFSFFLFSKADITKAIIAGLLLVPSVAVGIYVRFWSASAPVQATAEDDVVLPKALAVPDAYRDPILNHDVVRGFYSELFIRRPPSQVLRPPHTTPPLIDNDNNNTDASSSHDDFGDE